LTATFFMRHSVHCLKKTSHLWLTIIFTYTIRLQRFLAKILPRK